MAEAEFAESGLSTESKVLKALGLFAVMAIGFFLLCVVYFIKVSASQEMLQRIASENDQMASRIVDLYLVSSIPAAAVLFATNIFDSGKEVFDLINQRNAETEHLHPWVDICLCSLKFAAGLYEIFLLLIFGLTLFGIPGDALATVVKFLSGVL